MSQNQETATDRLVTIIQLIQLGRLTGRLATRRGEGLVQEEGSIVFVKGQVTRAIVGQRQGSEALNALTTWGNCRFLFLPTEDAQHTSGSLLLEESGSNGLPGKNGTKATASNGHIKGGLAVPYQYNSPDGAFHTGANQDLSRTHRRLLLLIDGRRPASELARLVGKSESEVDALLRELERADLIRFT
jgi:hypothetical protein